MARVLPMGHRPKIAAQLPQSSPHRNCASCDTDKIVEFHSVRLQYYAQPVATPKELVVQDQIREAIAELKNRFAIESVYIFGSHARGTSSEHSDLDLLVVFSRLDDDPFRVASEVQRQLHRSLDMPLDIIVTSRQEFALRERKNWTIEHVVAAEGIAV